MASLVDGIKDLLKFKVISIINTGDKTQDNLLNTVILTTITGIFTPGLQYQVQFLLGKLTSKCIKQKLSPSNYEAVRKYMEMNKLHFMQTAWVVKPCFNEDEITNALCQFVIKHYSWVFKKGSLFIIDKDQKKTIYKSPNENEWLILKKMFEFDVIYPVFLSGKDVVGLIRYTNDNSVYFIHNNDVILKTFIKHIIEEYDPPAVQTIPTDEKKTTRQCYVFDFDSSEKRMIYQDRTFDKIITKHKSKILNLLNNFKNANTQGKQSNFNGMGTYNLGLLFYGPPGTGKTSFIKATCNYLQRDAVIIDMRSIKTMTDLKNAFYVYLTSNSIYVFDEFDCVQDQLQRKNKSVKEEAKEIQTEINDILKIKATVINPTNAIALDEQITSLKTKKKNLENQLNLENMLTFLDGTVEMRNRVVIATTNCIDKIDSALIRAGRFDAKICLAEFDTNEIREQLCMMFPAENHERINLTPFPSGKFTPVNIANIVQETQSLDETIRILTTKDNGKRIISSESEVEGTPVKPKRHKRVYQ